MTSATHGLIFDRLPDGRVGVSDPSRRKRVAVSSDAALMAMKDPVRVAKLLSGSVGIDDPDGSGMLAWSHHNWDWAFPYYAWSRRSAYLDRDLAEADPTVLEQYRSESGVPAPRQLSNSALALPEPTHDPPGTIREVFLRRATVRRYAGRSTPIGEFAGLLWHGFARVRKLRQEDPEQRNPLRSFGSAFDVAIVVYSLEGLSPGVYWYDIASHAVDLGRPGSFREEADACLWRQGPPLTAAATIILVADYDRYQWRYRHERALRNLWIDAGRVAHVLILVGAAYRIGCFMTPAAHDSKLSALLGIEPWRQGPLYTVTVGPTGRGE